MASRIYVGGLPEGITDAELKQRFQSFGDVQSVEIVPDKMYPSLRPGAADLVFSRNFGFVSLVPKDEKTLQRALGVYNGSSWRGSVLRCKLAKPTTMAALEEERKEEEAEASKEKVNYSSKIMFFE